MRNGGILKILLLLLILINLGCVVENTPESVAKAYAKDLIYGDFDEAYELLCKSEKSSDFTSWRDEQETIYKVLRSQGISFTYEKVIQKQINENSAIVSVQYKVKFYPGVVQTRNLDIDLVKEDNVWKVSSYISVEELISGRTSTNKQQAKTKESTPSATLPQPETSPLEATPTSETIPPTQTTSLSETLRNIIPYSTTATSFGNTNGNEKDGNPSTTVFYGDEGSVSFILDKAYSVNLVRFYHQVDENGIYSVKIDTNDDKNFDYVVANNVQGQGQCTGGDPSNCLDFWEWKEFNIPNITAYGISYETCCGGSVEVRLGEFEAYSNAL